MKNLLQPTPEQLLEAQLDITAPSDSVEVLINPDNTILWINVGGVCVLRICRALIAVNRP